MASPNYQTKDNILPISNDDFFRHHHCPMRAVNTRCPNLSACERVHFGDQAAPQKAAKICDQIMQQIESSKHEASMPGSRIWTDIEPKVVKLMKWVLCQRHMPHYNAAASMVIRFLKEENGVFVEEQSAQEQSHSNEPARINDNSASSGLGSGAPYSTYTSATSHLVTPPMSPGTIAQEKAYQDQSASYVTTSFRDGAAFKLPPQSPFVFHMDGPVKTGLKSKAPDTDNQWTPCSITPRAAVQSEGPPGTKPSRQQHELDGFRVRQRSRSRQPSDNDPAAQPPTDTTKETPPFGFTVRPRSGTTTPKSQSRKPQPPSGLTVREHAADPAPVAQPCSSSTSNYSTSAHGKHRDSFDLAGQNVSVQSPRSEVDELVERLKKSELRNKKLKERYEHEKEKLEEKFDEEKDKIEETFEDEKKELEEEIEKLLVDNEMRLAANEALLNDKKRLKAMYHAAEERIGELEGEAESLRTQVHGFREKTTRMATEIVRLKRHARVGE